MGLRLAWVGRAIEGLGRDGRWSLPVAFICFALLSELAGEPARQLLRYSRSAIAEGELWRLVSGHLVHLGWPHMLMNALALIAIWALVGQNLRQLQWLFVAVFTLAGIDAGFWWLNAGLEWYVGLSGLLHGLLAAGLLAGLARRRAEALLLGSLLAAKLLYEQLVGALPGSAEAAGGAVVVDAHLYGTVAGAVAMLLLGGKVAVRPARQRAGAARRDVARGDLDNKND